MTIHSCGYHCDKPGCIKEQRDDLVKKFIVNARKPLTLQQVDLIWETKTDIESVVRAVEKMHGIGDEA